MRDGFDAPRQGARAQNKGELNGRHAVLASCLGARRRVCAEEARRRGDRVLAKQRRERRESVRLVWQERHRRAHAPPLVIWPARDADGHWCSPGSRGSRAPRARNGPRRPECGGLDVWESRREKTKSRTSFVVVRRRRLLITGVGWITARCFVCAERERTCGIVDWERWRETAEREGARVKRESSKEQSSLPSLSLSSLSLLPISSFRPLCPIVPRDTRRQTAPRWRSRRTSTSPSNPLIGPRERTFIGLSSASFVVERRAAGGGGANSSAAASASASASAFEEVAACSWFSHKARNTDKKKNRLPSNWTQQQERAHTHTYAHTHKPSHQRIKKFTFSNKRLAPRRPLKRPLVATRPIRQVGTRAR
jgi:hypothetical protein